VQLTEMQKLAYGERRSAGNADAARIDALHAVMSGAGFDARISQEIERDMWEKWVFLATLGGITCLMRGTIGEIEAAPGGAALARQLLGECAAVAVASGHAPTASFLEQTAATLTAKGSGLASSMYRDLQRGLNVEVDQILGDMVVRAQHLAVPTPLLATAFANLRVYQQRLAAARSSSEKR
jgi:2-dehydropantoate 2-reductase